MYAQFFMLFAMIFTGFFLKRIKIIKEDFMPGLNKLVLSFTFPCMVLYNTGTLNIDKALIGDVGIAFVIMLLLFVVYSLVAKLYIRIRKFPKHQHCVLETAMVSPNNGFMGFPIALMFFGQMGTLFMAVHNIIYNLYLFSYGTMIIEGTEKTENFKTHLKVLLKACVNPIVICVVIGGFIGFFSVPLDNIVGDYIKLMGSMATPLAMISIGATLAKHNILDMFKDHMVWESSVMKNLAMPIITLALMYFLPINPDIKSIAVLASAMPMGATTAIIVTENNKDAKLAGNILFFTTLLAMATMPMMIWILESIA